MSDQFPPPPSEPTPPPPPPPSWSAPPPGYVAAPVGFDGSAPLRQTRGLAKAMITLYWCSVGAMALMSLAIWRKRSVADDVWNNSGSSTIQDVNDANGLVASAFVLLIGLFIAAAIVTAVWSYRAASNAKARGANDVSPGLAAGGWFIPIGNLFVQWMQLRRVARGLGRSKSNVSWWQGLFIAQGITLRVSGSSSEDNVLDQGYIDMLTTALVFSVIGTVLYAVTTIVAKRATVDLEADVTGEAG